MGNELGLTLTEEQKALQKFCRPCGALEGAAEGSYEASAAKRLIVERKLAPMLAPSDYKYEGLPSYECPICCGSPLLRSPPFSSPLTLSSATPPDASFRAPSRHLSGPHQHALLLQQGHLHRVLPPDPRRAERVRFLQRGGLARDLGRPREVRSQVSQGARDAVHL